jgi:hypothetical protein
MDLEELQGEREKERERESESNRGDGRRVYEIPFSHAWVE